LAVVEMGLHFSGLWCKRQSISASFCTACCVRWTILPRCRREVSSSECTGRKRKMKLAIQRAMANEEKI
jgi:hypothetical protein